MARYIWTARTKIILPQTIEPERLQKHRLSIAHIVELSSDEESDVVCTYRSAGRHHNIPISAGGRTQELFTGAREVVRLHIEGELVLRSAGPRCSSNEAGHRPAVLCGEPAGLDLDLLDRFLDDVDVVGIVVWIRGTGTVDGIGNFTRPTTTDI